MENRIDASEHNGHMRPLDRGPLPIWIDCLLDKHYAHNGKSIRGCCGGGKSAELCVCRIKCIIDCVKVLCMRLPQYYKNVATGIMQRRAMGSNSRQATLIILIVNPKTQSMCCVHATSAATQFNIHLECSI